MTSISPCCGCGRCTACEAATAVTQTARPHPGTPAADAANGGGTTTAPDTTTTTTPDTETPRPPTPLAGGATATTDGDLPPLPDVPQPTDGTVLGWTDALPAWLGNAVGAPATPDLTGVWTYTGLPAGVDFNLAGLLTPQGANPDSVAN